MDLKPDMYFTNTAGPSVVIGKAALQAEPTDMGGLVVRVNGRTVIEIRPDDKGRECGAPRYIGTLNDRDVVFIGDGIVLMACTDAPRAALEDWIGRGPDEVKHLLDLIGTGAPTRAMSTALGTVLAMVQAVRPED